MNCIIIEDDELSKKVLEEYVKRTDSLTLVATFRNAIDAINHLSNKTKVDLVFLDIELPEMTGVEFLESIQQHPQVIITSSKEKYALTAFDFDVTDYILKPIRYPRFYKAVEKAHKISKFSEFSQTDNEIFIKKGSSLVKLSFNDIHWVEALENYVVLYTGSGKYTIHFTMKAMANNLPYHHFIRIHRSYIANTRLITAIYDKNVELTVNDQKYTLPLGKSFRDELLSKINLMNR
ncbi:MAG: response regulator transcription factor [Chlorobi bacterium]|nr:response regulator transcription factor [Chlorobiota bacterium]